MLSRRSDEMMDGLAAEVSGFGSRLTRVEVKVDEGFEKVDKRFERVDGELLEQRQEARELRREMRTGFERIDDRFERMQRTMLEAAVAIIVALVWSPHL